MTTVEIRQLNPEVVGESDRQQEKLWRKYRLAGDPPPPDSEAAKRLREKCEEYIDCILGDKSKITGSDKRRRVLHNEIGVMILGEGRSEENAKLISDFASELVVGCPLEEAYKLYSER